MFIREESQTKNPNINFSKGGGAPKFKGANAQQCCGQKPCPDLNNIAQSQTVDKQ